MLVQEPGGVHWDRTGTTTLYTMSNTNFCAISAIFYRHKTHPSLYRQRDKRGQMCDTAEAEMRRTYLLVSDSVCHDSYIPTSIQNQTCYTASPETPAHQPAQPWCSRGRWDGRI